VGREVESFDSFGSPRGGSILSEKPFPGGLYFNWRGKGGGKGIYVSSLGCSLKDFSPGEGGFDHAKWVSHIGKVGKVIALGGGIYRWKKDNFPIVNQKKRAAGGKGRDSLISRKDNG